MDALYHYTWALQISNGEWIGKEIFFRAPFYPYFLGIVYHITGDHFFLPRLIQILIGSFSCVVIYWIALELRNCRKTAVIAGLISATYWISIYFEGELLLDSFGAFFNICMLLLLLRAPKNTKHPHALWFMSGVLFGLSSITRPNILVFMPIVFWWIWKNTRSQKKNEILLKSAVFLFGAGILISPVTIRNAIVGNDFVLISSQAGLNFYIGNNPKSNGWSALAPGMRGSWQGGINDATRIAETESRRQLKPSEISQYWFNRGFDFFKEKPFEAIRHLLKKSILFVGKHEIKNNKDPNFLRKFSKLLNFLPLHFGIIFPFAIGGFVALLLLKKISSKDVMILFYFILYSSSIIVFFICARYRLPILPILMIYSASAVILLIECITKKSYKEISVIIIAIALASLISNIDFFNFGKIGFAQSYFNLASNYYEEGKYDKAIANYQKAIESKPEMIHSYTNLSVIYAQNKEYSKSIAVLKNLLSVNPNALLAYEYLAIIHVETGNLNRAVSLLEELLKKIPPHRAEYKTNIQQWHAQLSLALRENMVPVDEKKSSNP
jgi:4-amino-4-deoxy-L-arabinose transferase-like glycosyltransferase